MNKGFHDFISGVDCTLPFNNSVDFILQNFGSFSPLVRIQEFSTFSRNFSAVSQKLLLSLNIKDTLTTRYAKALWMHVSQVSCHLQLDALPVLTMEQLVELVFNTPASPENRTNILTGVFDFLLRAVNRDRLNNFLPSLRTQARKVFNTTLHITCVEMHLATTTLLLLLCFLKVYRLKYLKWNSKMIVVVYLSTLLSVLILCNNFTISLFCPAGKLHMWKLQCHVSPVF